MLAGSPGKVLTYVDLEPTLPVDPESLAGPSPSTLVPDLTFSHPYPSTSCHPHASSWFPLDQAAQACCSRPLLPLSLESFPQLSPSRCYSVFSMRAPLTPALCLTPEGTPSPCLWPDSSPKDEGFFSFLSCFVLCSNPMPGTISGAFRPSDNIHSINEFKANFLIFFKACLILVPQEKMGTLVPKVQVLPRPSGK